MRNTLVYIGPNTRGAEALGIGESDRAEKLSDGSVLFSYRQASTGWRSEQRMHCFDDAGSAALFMRQNPVQALVLDTRGDSRAFDRSRAGLLLAKLYPADGARGALTREHIIGIVDASTAGTRVAFELGKYGVGTIVLAESGSHPPDILKELDRILQRRGGGRIALCLAGGGIEGLFYEVGVLRALESFLVDKSIVDFDLFCGISAGAALSAFLANGLGPEEIARGLDGRSLRLDPITRADLFDLNLGEFARRSAWLAGDLIRGGTGPRGWMSSVTRALPGGAFAGSRFRSWMRTQLSKPGMSDNFDNLRRPLYIGATDQDTSRAVVFGDQGLRHVPIHRAVRASAALVPFYAPERIDGRYYIDGGFSRTTNMRVAVDKGATLVILVDPLVPVFSREAGYVHTRGGIFATMQGLKALINARFDKAVDAISDMYPDVAFHLFKPEADEMRILSGSPMKYFYRREIEEIAYKMTVDKIRASLPQMMADFALHGVTLRDPEARRSTLPPRVMRLEPEALGVGA